MAEHAILVDETGTPVRFKATKAIVGAGIAVVLAFLGSVVTAMAPVVDAAGTVVEAQGVINSTEWVTASIAALVVAGGVFGGVYTTTNDVKRG